MPLSCLWISVTPPKPSFLLCWSLLPACFALSSISFLHHHLASRVLFLFRQLLHPSSGFFSQFLHDVGANMSRWLPWRKRSLFKKRKKFDFPLLGTSVCLNVFSFFFFKNTSCNCFLSHAHTHYEPSSFNLILFASFLIWSSVWISFPCTLLYLITVCWSRNCALCFWKTFQPICRSDVRSVSTSASRWQVTCIASTVSLLDI